MENILKGGSEAIEYIVGGKGPIGVFSLGITIFACIVLVLLVWFMSSHQPSSIIGQIGFAIGLLVSITLALFICIRGISVMTKGIL